MKVLVLMTLLLATTYAAPTTLDVASDSSDEEWRERKIHQFEATPNNTFARHPERQIIGVLNTDFVPSDEYTDFLLAYLPDITEILKEVKIANGGEMPPLGNNPSHWLKMLLPLGRRYLQTRASLEGRDHLWSGEEKALNFIDRVTDPMMQFVQELSDV
ncbi:unnamed protein product [Meganyctiphanes norvegica]|uniref:Uncharacterized protein n=1 Tax=Meganyctiphanes norvegica TaxID=48144 RepID=A0AAV2S9E5_MEGNR